MDMDDGQAWARARNLPGSGGALVKINREQEQAEGPAEAESIESDGIKVGGMIFG